MMGKMVCHEFFCVKIIVELKTKAIFAPAIGNNRGCFKFGSVVQLVRIHACHAWGRGFESRPDRFLFLLPLFKFSFNTYFNTISSGSMDFA